MSLFGSISYRDVIEFTNYLSSAIKTGLPIAEIVNEIAERSSNKNFRKMLVQISNDIRKGDSFYKALSKYPSIFDAFYLNIIRIGEQSGKLDENLAYLAEHMKKYVEFKRKIQSALIYPFIIILLGFSEILLISIFILPKLAKIFTSLNLPVPMYINIFVVFSNIMEHFWIYIVIEVILFIFFLKLFISFPYIKSFWQKTLLFLPVVRDAVIYREMAIICRNLGMLIRGGFTPSSALKITSETIDSIRYTEMLHSMEKLVLQGKSLEFCFSSVPQKYIPAIATKTIGMGEKSGAIDNCLLKLGDFFENELESKIKKFVTLLEPMLTVGIALTIGIIGISFIGSIYGLIGNIVK